MTEKSASSNQPPVSADQIRGETLREISSAIVGLYREHFGKGPTAAKTYVLDDLVICVLRNGLTTVEKTLFERGRADAVREVRSAFQDAVADTFTGAIEWLTNRRVVAFMSQAHVEPDLAVEVFFLDRDVTTAAIVAEHELEVDDPSAGGLSPNA